MIGLPVGQAGLLALWLLNSPWMLFWALAAIVPVLIHFWSRRKHEEVPWAAMRFLLAAVRKNARRWRIEQLILLAVRMLILILLALALADPMVMLLGAGGEDAERHGNHHYVMVLDASYSMDYRQAEATRFELAKGLASERVRQGVQGDGFTLLRMADPPDVLVAQPVFDRESVVTEIGQLQRLDGGADLAATLAEIERVLEQATRDTPRLVHHRVCFFTDLGKNTWGEVTSEAVQATLSRLADKATLTVIDLGQSGGQNVAVTRLATADSVLSVGVPARLEIELENFGNQDRLAQRIDILVDGQKVAQSETNVAAGGRAGLSVEHRFQTPGEHVVEVQLGEDRLQADNRRWLCVQVRAALEVLCVEGKAGAARNVALALEPGASSQMLVHPVVRSEIALLEEDLGRYDAVFLCNVGRFTKDEARLLRQFLQRGGGVVVFLGDQVQQENYNSLLGVDAGRSRCFSTRLGEGSAVGQYAFDPLDYEHAIVAPFRGHQRSGLLTTPVWKYVNLTTEPGSDVELALAFQHGPAAIVQEAVGNGRVVLVATDASTVSLDRSTEPPTPWSALATWPSFPPLVHQMLRVVVAGRRELRNTLVGQALHGVLPAGSSDTSVVVTDPEGRQQRLPVEVLAGVSQWTYPRTRWGGVYQVAVGGSSEPPQRYAINLDNRESRLDRLEEGLLPRQLRAEAATGDGAATAMEISRPVPYFRYLLGGVLALLVSESFLAWFLGRGAA
jgi:hypothetical protein